MLNCALLTKIMTKRYGPWSNKCYPHKAQKYRYPKSVKIFILSQTSFLADLWADSYRVFPFYYGRCFGKGLGSNIDCVKYILFSPKSSMYREIGEIQVAKGLCSGDSYNMHDVTRFRAIHIL